jgi:release factor glutamine methyltransferase
MLKEKLRSARQKLQNIEIPTSDAEHLAAHVLGVNRMELHAREYAFTEDQEREFEDLLNKRIEGIPLQYLTGLAPFRYLEIEVGPGVLIPRPETELLVDAALVEIERIQSDVNWNTRPTSIVDLGSGSGAIAISIADEANRRGLKVQVIAVESEENAIKWLKQNIAKHEVDIRVVAANVTDALIDVKCDLVISNPPYIPIEIKETLPTELSFEPASALFGGSAGVEVPKLFIAAATRLLKSGGLFLMEHHETQSREIEKILESTFGEIQNYLDLNGRSRWVAARRLKLES